MYVCKRNWKIIELPIGNETICFLLSADDHAITAQNKGDAEYMTKINRIISEMGIKCK